MSAIYTPIENERMEITESTTLQQLEIACTRLGITRLKLETSPGHLTCHIQKKGESASGEGPTFATAIAAALKNLGGTAPEFQAKACPPGFFCWHDVPCSGARR